MFCQGRDRDTDVQSGLVAAAGAERWDGLRAALAHTVVCKLAAGGSCCTAQGAQLGAR